MNKKFHGEFDPEFDKLPDQPVTIGGDKSAAAWHPGSGPEVPHAELIAEARQYAGVDEYGGAALIRELADALAALGDTVPREQAERAARDAMVREARLLDERDKARAERDALQRGLVAATERAEAAEAERDALAHVIEQAPHTRGCDTWNVNTDDDHCMCWKSTAPAVSLALHDAEVKAQALDEAAAEARRKWEPYTCPWVGFLDDRAAAIRAEAGR